MIFLSCLVVTVEKRIVQEGIGRELCCFITELAWQTFGQGSPPENSVLVDKQMERLLNLCCCLFGQSRLLVRESILRKVLTPTTYHCHDGSKVMLV